MYLLPILSILTITSIILFFKKNKSENLIFGNTMFIICLMVIGWLALGMSLTIKTENTNVKKSNIEYYETIYYHVFIVDKYLYSINKKYKIVIDDVNKYNLKNYYNLYNMENKKNLIIYNNNDTIVANNKMILN